MRALIAGLLALFATATAAAAPPAGPPMRLGSNVHFAQGWGESVHGTLRASGAATVREALGWRVVESKRGVYSFGATTSGQIDRLCADGYRVVLVTLMTNPLYDAGNTVYSTVGRKAFANYLAAVARRYVDCLAAIEIGNEINNKPAFTGVASRTPAASYVAILQSVYPAVKAAAPNVAVLGGSANSIATGFEIALADAGMLDVVDGIAIHPYRQDPSNVDWELARLRAVLAARRPAGAPPVPIWITEFSKDFAATENPANFFAKMVTMMSATGVSEAQWYALIDQAAFPTMGLYTPGGASKPAGDAFRWFGSDVLPRGGAVRLSTDNTLFHYRFGADRQIVWGAARSIVYSGPATARDSRGRPIALPTTVSEAPVIIEGDVTLSFGDSALLADSLWGYGRAPWSYHAQRGRQPELTLAPIDWNYASFISHPTLRPATINQFGLVAVGFRNSTRLITRWTAPAPGRIVALACMQRRNTTGDGGSLQIQHNGVVVRPVAITGADPVRVAVPITVASGDRVDFVVLPEFDPKGDNFANRFQIAREGVEPPDC
ncbi:hypothetical protein IP88_03315 [alpha proteobacterium AAP81b]|nr:hypothetical protein IP88_03315 [alpha proteobacterium AAP81b]